MTLSVVIQAQCTFDFSADILDLQTIDLQIQVDNLVNDDLSGSQGICAVQLHFRHSYVGDLTIDLISPAGQSVQLVGAVTDLINPTNLTTWDVRFLRCGFPAAPDAGFSAQWDNNQAWQVFTTYTGSYYPAIGCLEDFNTGSANGIWHLSITDHDAPQTGVLLGVTLIFCDDTGLECNFCGADAGTFSQTQLSVCEGSDAIINPFYSDTIPDPQLFGYQYLLTRNNVTTSYFDEIPASAFSPGMYTICGLSYSIVDSVALFMQLDTMTFGEIQLAFMNSELTHCADLTQNCITLDIDPFVDTTFLDMQICSGESVTIGGQSFSTTGTHLVTIDVNGSCDSVVVLDLEVTYVEARVQQQDTISCTQSTTVLDASSSIAGPGATYLWSTQNGTITSPPDQSLISIDGPGTYLLRVSDQGCIDELAYTVIGDESIPFIAVSGGVIDCNSSSFTFNAVVFPTNVTTEWSGPNGFVSGLLNPTVTTPGSYELLVTDLADCTASAIVEVVLDTTSIMPQIVTTIDCMNGRTFLSGTPGNLEYQYHWTGPNGFTNQTRQFWTSEPGVYCATLTPPNGCESTTCIEILADYSIPDVLLMASADTIHCGGQIDLSISTAVTGASFVWYGPAGQFSSEQSVSVFEGGTYIASVVSPNGCTNSDTVIVNAGPDVFDVITFGDTITCAVDTALIGVVTIAPGASYIWSGPGLVDSFSAFVGAVVPGLYQAMVSVGTCVQTFTVRVAEDFSIPNFRPFTDTISCLEPVAELSILISSPYEEILWQLPDGSLSMDSVLLTTQSGIYTLSVSSANGCMGIRQVFVPIDTFPPQLFFDSELLGCDSVQIQIISVDSIIDFDWSGPGGFVSDDLNPFVYEPGNYILNATGSNGCTATRTHFVDTSQVRPVFQIDAEVLDCIDSSAVLTIVSMDTALTYAWYFGGLQISDTAVVTVMNPGQYIGEATGLNGCSLQDTINLMAPIVPQAFAQSDSITCISDATLTAMSDLMNVSFFWEDAVGMTDTGVQFITGSAGLVRLTATGSNGCVGETSVIVGIDTIPPLAIAISNEFILCDVQSINLDASGSIGNLLSYSWSTPNGMIQAGANSVSPQIMGSGSYVLRVVDASNGCVDTDTLEVFEVESPLKEISLTVISECEGNEHGSITIDSVMGATTALGFTLNGETGGPVFDDLSVGEYHVVVEDSFGCSIDTVVFISNTSSTNTISLGEDKSIVLGDSVLLEAVVDLDPTEIMDVHWGQPVDCDSCLLNSVSPLHTTIYEVFLTDLFGCLASDAITVFVEEKAKFYVPNVFSPNGDEINDYLAIVTHPGIERVLRFSVFDRWGNVVFDVSDFKADGSVHWDGTFSGEKLDPAVFVYKIDVKLVTGRVETHHGTITLVK